MLVALPAVAVAQDAPAAASEAADPSHFTINHFDVKGSTLLPAALVDKTVAPYTGAGKDFGDIQHALQALETEYHNRGYTAVRVQLPEQDITSGTVELDVLEPKLTAVNVEGNKFFNTKNVLWSLPSLKEGSMPNAPDIARNLQMLEEQPIKRTAVLLKTDEDDGGIVATAKIDDSKPWRLFGSVDNTGNSTTGEIRTGVGAQYANLFNRDQVATLQYVSAPAHWGDVKIIGGSYHIPLYQYNSSFDIVGGWANVNSGVLQNLFNVSGSGTIAGGRYNYYLPKIGDYSHKITLGQDYRAYKNNVAVLGGGPSVVPDITVQPSSFTYSGLWRAKDRQVNFYASVVQNIFHDNNDGTDKDFKASRAEATSSYRIYRGGLNYIERMPYDVQLRTALNFQITRDALVPGEQFGFGGATSVRGFDEREVSNDRGFVLNLEGYTPDFGGWFKKWLHWGDTASMRALVFYDLGYLHRNKVQALDSRGQAGASIGTGFRFALGDSFSLRADLARVVNAAGVEEKGDSRIQFSAVVVY